jgi:hypothetical protein
MNKCIKIENIYIFIIISYCKYNNCISFLSVDMEKNLPKTKSSEEEDITSIRRGFKLLSKNKEELSEKDLNEADKIIMSFLGTQFHDDANFLLEMKTKKAQELAQELAQKEAEHRRTFLNAMYGLPPNA